MASHWPPEKLPIKEADLGPLVYTIHFGCSFCPAAACLAHIGSSQHVPFHKEAIRSPKEEHAIHWQTPKAAARQ
jgi:hypothetical protein